MLMKFAKQKDKNVLFKFTNLKQVEYAFKITSKSIFSGRYVCNIHDFYWFDHLFVYASKRSIKLQISVKHILAISTTRGISVDHTIFGNVNEPDVISPFAFTVLFLIGGFLAFKSRSRLT